MKVTIYGAGYVGLVTGVCLADLGHEVLCCDISAERIALLSQAIPPIYEEGLEALLQLHLKNGRLRFTTDAEAAVAFASVQMIAVGTPAKADGSSDLQYVDAVAETIALYMQEYKLIINKSTVLMGTADRVATVIKRQLLSRNSDFSFDVASNPEFLREGQAIYDFLHPDRIVVGANNEAAMALLHQLYAPLVKQGYCLLPMSVRSAELTKYAANALLATKVSFINEMSRIAELSGADISEVKQGVGMDARISAQFLNPGCGFGGSCFPKDVSALSMAAQAQNYDAPILNAVIKTNIQQQQHLFAKLSCYFDNDLEGKRIALWGLAFKPNTDDIRCAPSRFLMERLWQSGALVQAYDPMAMPAVQRAYPDQPGLQLCDTANAALEAVDALVIVTEWTVFKQPDWAHLINSMCRPVIIDGRNLFNANDLRDIPVDYLSIGRADILHANAAVNL